MFTAIQTFSFDPNPHKSHQGRTRVKNFFIDHSFHFLDIPLPDTFIFLAKILRLSDSGHKFEKFVIIVSINKFVLVNPPKVIAPGLHSSHLNIV